MDMCSFLIIIWNNKKDVESTGVSDSLASLVGVSFLR